MELDFLLQIAKIATPSFVAFFFIWKIVIPWSEYFLNKSNASHLNKRLTKIEKNDIHELKELCDEFKAFKREAWSKINELSDRISKIEGKLGL